MQKRNNKKILTNDVILEMTYQFRASRILLTAFELNIFTHLDSKRMTAVEMAKSIKTDARATDRLMNALCIFGFLKKSRGVFSNAELSSKFLVNGKPDYMMNLHHINNLWNNWSALTTVVRKGGTISEKTVSQKGEKSVADFISAMHYYAKQRAPKVISLIDLKNVKSVLDVGGGSGAYSIEFVRRSEGINAAVFDLETVVPLTKKFIKEEGFEKRIKTIIGDYNTDEFRGKYDIVFLSAIIHSNSAKENQRLINKCYKALNPNGKIIISDFIMSGDRLSPAVGVLFSLNMLVNTKEGDTFTLGEIKSWMLNAGFKSVKYKPTELDTALVIGSKLEV